MTVKDLKANANYWECVMLREAFDKQMFKIAGELAGKPVDGAMAEYLNKTYPADGEIFRKIEALSLKAVAEGWMCDRDAGGIRFGRVLKPDEATRDFSVDVVYMKNVKGPHHVHTTGEIGMIMPITEGAEFDGMGRGWYVYPPGSAHHPTVTGGEALVLYLLPQGSIEFTGR